MNPYAMMSVAALYKVWFNGCVGEKNYKYFLLYLVVSPSLSFVHTDNGSSAY